MLLMETPRLLERGYEAQRPISGSVDYRAELEGHSHFQNLPSL